MVEGPVRVSGNIDIPVFFLNPGLERCHQELLQIPPDSIPNIKMTCRFNRKPSKERQQHDWQPGDEKAHWFGITCMFVSAWAVRRSSVYENKKIFHVCRYQSLTPDGQIPRNVPGSVRFPGSEINV